MPGRGADGKGERRDVADDQARAELAQHTRLAGRAGHEIAVKGRLRGGCVSASSSVSASICTTPVSHSSVREVTLPLTVRSNSHRGAEVRTPMRVSGRLRENGVDHLDAA